MQELFSILDLLKYIISFVLQDAVPDAPEPVLEVKVTSVAPSEINHQHQ